MPYQFTACYTTRFVDEGADLIQLELRVEIREREIERGLFTKRGFMDREVGESHCLHFAIGVFAKRGTPQLGIE